MLQGNERAPSGCWWTFIADSEGKKFEDIFGHPSRHARGKEEEELLQKVEKSTSWNVAVGAQGYVVYLNLQEAPYSRLELRPVDNRVGSGWEIQEVDDDTD